MLKIVIAEDQKMLLGAIGSLLNLEVDMEVIGQAVNGDEVWRLIQEKQPDVCLLDIEMPGKSGLEVAGLLNKLKQRPRIIVLTTFAKPGYFEKAVKAGVDGYLLKDRSIEELTAAIRKVVHGEKVYSQELMVDYMCDPNPLSEREQEILRLVAEGKTTKELTNILYLSYGTIRNYLSEIMQKLEAKNRLEAVDIARNKGWI
ncbi:MULTISPECIES: response regulator transcription factor [Virgibacillus]|uniref:Response regulator transcription factor n=1 Tax=Virgibacillus dokdonensis TaxID=302167 RepID=A0A2K9IYX4_9BACI|nr:MULTISPECIES: response regulator transcription factor [Virgibacillus]AUJ24922.1 Transcriptional regulatory protein DegU [Virgibacillus dokdonensis]NWO12092.1 response regulator transcription factor [Virgibacillus sp.]